MSKADGERALQLGRSEDVDMCMDGSWMTTNVHPCVAENPMCRNDFMV
jgi:hypothetical protein